jgi:predicted transcriptional regulator
MAIPSTTIRIPADMHETLRGLAEEHQSTLQGVLVEALELYRRDRFLRRVNDGYAALRAEPAAWKAHLAERATWDTTLADGLPAERPGVRRKKR